MKLSIFEKESIEINHPIDSQHHLKCVVSSGIHFLKNSPPPHSLQYSGF